MGTSIVNTKAEDYEKEMPSLIRRGVASKHLSQVAESMDRFIDKIKEGRPSKEGSLATLEIVRISHLHLYRRANATSRGSGLYRGNRDHPFA